MTDWIDFGIYAVFLFALWFYAPTVQANLRVPLLLDRNPDWVRAHPDEVARIDASRWRLWLSYALGAVSLAVLAAYQTGLWQAGEGRAPGWMVLWGLTIASTFVAILVGVTNRVISHVRMSRMVPIAPRRQASLAPRSLADHVPAWIRYPVYALVLGNLAAWFAAAALGAHSSPVFWPRVVTMVVLTVFFHVATRLAVNRRPNVMDRLFGPEYRRRETRFVFAMQITTPIVGALRLYEEVSASQLFDASRAVQLLLSLFIIYGLVRLSGTSLDRSQPGNGSSAIPSAT